MPMKLPSDPKDSVVYLKGYCDGKLDYEAKQPPTEKIGKWILNDNGTYSCSLCQSWIPNEQHHYARYCLHCGARME